MTTTSFPLPQKGKPFWRREDPVIEFVNDNRLRLIKGGLFEHQRQWWDLPNFVRILVGGFGCGKTQVLAKWLIGGALLNAPVWSACVSPTFAMARRTIVPTIATMLRGKETVRPDLRWSHNRSEHRFSIELDGLPEATILYQSGDDPDSLKGPNLGQVGIDEPFLQHRAVFEMMAARCRDPRAKLLAIGMTGTPEELNWGYELCEGELRQRWDVGVVAGVDTAKNLALPLAYRQRLIAGYDSRAASAYVGGQFVSLASGQVYYAFDRAVNVQELSIGPDADWFWATDFNVDPMAFCVGARIGDRIHIVDEFEQPNADTQYAASTIREKYPHIRKTYPDPSGRSRRTAVGGGTSGGWSDFLTLQRAGFTVLAPQAPWPLRDSLNAVNVKLGNGTLTVSPNCKRLIRYLSEYSHQKANTVAHKAMSHLLDAMRYGVTFQFPSYRITAKQVALVGA